MEGTLLALLVRLEASIQRLEQENAALRGALDSKTETPSE